MILIFLKFDLQSKIQVINDCDDVDDHDENDDDGD